MSRNFRVITVCVLGALLLSGCSSEKEDWAKELANQALGAKSDLGLLKTQIENKSIRNVVLLAQYAAIIRKQKPDYAAIVDVLAKDATIDGPIFSGLQRRLKENNEKASGAVAGGVQAVRAVVDEFVAIRTSASIARFGMILTDPINVLADMSDGKLARVQAMSKEAVLAANKATDMGAGSQLVGNPNYGSWRQNSSGGSFWQWYGQYAFFSTIFRRPIYYGSWASNRGYSYYHDYGRSYYNSPAQNRSQQALQTRTKQKFSKSGKTFNSPYSKTRTGSPTAKRLASVNTGRSRYSTPSKFSGNSSSRSSSYRTSRSSSSGK